jgi:hypothetical protein
VSHPTDDELADLALGETVDAEVTAHVAGCETCSASVEQLRRAAHLAASPAAYAAWQAPDDAVWARVTAQIDAEERREGPGGAEGVPVHATDAPGQVTRVDRFTRRRTAAWAAGLVAASLVVGLLAGRAIWSPDTGRQVPQVPQVAQVAQVPLATLDTKQREGEATLVRAANGLDLRVVTTRPLDAGKGYLEVWLINADGKRMVSVGVLQPGESGTFPVTQALIDQGYVIVDISKEQFDDKPAHSGDSLLRGQLPA